VGSAPGISSANRLISSSARSQYSSCENIGTSRRHGAVCGIPRQPFGISF
jgi:hypothetical protein